jgi:hypothetical protein
MKTVLILVDNVIGFILEEQQVVEFVDTSLQVYGEC